MATIDEHPERYGWWVNELESLGIADADRSNNNKAELEALAQNTKEMIFQNYEIGYDMMIDNDLTDQANLDTVEDKAS